MAIAAGQLSKFNFLFEYFEPWIVGRQLDAGALDNETYGDFFADLSVDGCKAKSLRNWIARAADRQIESGGLPVRAGS
jgi:hypothetical protein